MIKDVLEFYTYIHQYKCYFIHTTALRFNPVWAGKFKRLNISTQRSVKDKLDIREALS